MTSGDCQPAPASVRPRPRHGETADSYLRRLAAVNHLRFTYLRRYLATPAAATAPSTPASWPPSPAASRPRSCAPSPSWPGRPQARRTAIHAGRTSSGTTPPSGRSTPPSAATPKRACPERAIERSHHVGRRTVVKALASADPPERKKIHREPAALNGLHDHIDAMIEADPEIGTATIWQRLADDHGATVAYSTLRTYVTSQRTSRKTPGKTSEDEPR